MLRSTDPSDGPRPRTAQSNVPSHNAHAIVFDFSAFGDFASRLAEYQDFLIDKIGETAFRGFEAPKKNRGTWTVVLRDAAAVEELVARRNDFTINSKTVPFGAAYNPGRRSVDLEVRDFRLDFSSPEGLRRTGKAIHDAIASKKVGRIVDVAISGRPGEDGRSFDPKRAIAVARVTLADAVPDLAKIGRTIIVEGCEVPLWYPGLDRACPLCHREGHRETECSTTIPDYDGELGAYEALARVSNTSIHAPPVATPAAMIGRSTDALRTPPHRPLPGPPAAENARNGGLLNFIPVQNKKSQKEKNVNEKTKKKGPNDITMGEPGTPTKGLSNPFDLVSDEEAAEACGMIGAADASMIDGQTARERIEQLQETDTDMDDGSCDEASEEVLASMGPKTSRRSSSRQRAKASRSKKPIKDVYLESAQLETTIAIAQNRNRALLVEAAHHDAGTQTRKAIDITREAIGNMVAAWTARLQGLPEQADATWSAAQYADVLDQVQSDEEWLTSTQKMIAATQAHTTPLHESIKGKPWGPTPHPPSSYPPSTDQASTGLGGAQ
jgi:hypothetical protein